MTLQKMTINDMRNTIHRLQNECTEKTNVIVKLSEQLSEYNKLKEEMKQTKFKTMSEFLIAQAMSDEFKHKYNQICVDRDHWKQRAIKAENELKTIKNCGENNGKIR